MRQSESLSSHSDVDDTVAVLGPNGMCVVRRVLSHFQPFGLFPRTILWVHGLLFWLEVCRVPEPPSSCLFLCFLDHPTARSQYRAEML